jgi:uncharacterized membrane protein
MNTLDRFALFAPLDLAAFALLILCWCLINLLIAHPPKSRPPVSVLMANYRREWMVQMLTREPRIFDAQIVSNLRQGTAFFASTSVIAIGGTLALIGNADQLAGLAQDLTLAEDTKNYTIVSEIKLLVLAIFLIDAFLKFVWSNRLFGYCSVLMAAVPNDATHPEAANLSAKAGEINITAARSFNQGLRSIYFALASAAWLVGPAALIFAALVTFVVIWRREFASHSRRILLEK